MSKYIAIIPKGKPYLMIPLGLGFVYAEKGGGLVLKTETHWSKISGFVLNTRWGCVWIKFRRFNKYGL